MSRQKYVFVVLLLAFDRLAKASTLIFNANSSNYISEVSCSLSSSSLLLKFVTNLFKPWEILTHEWELSSFTDSILISTPYLHCKQQVVTSNTGPFLVSPRIQSFGSDDFHPLAKCTHDMPLILWIVRILQCLLSWSAVRLQLLSEILHQYKLLSHEFCCESLSTTRSWYFCNRSSCAGSSVEGVGVFVNKLAGSNNRSGCPASTGLPVLTWQALYSSHKSETAP